MPADDNQDQTLNSTTTNDDVLTSGPLPFGKTEDKAESDTQPVDTDVQRGNDDITPDGESSVQDVLENKGDEVKEELERPNLTEPTGLPPLPDVEIERGVPPVLGNLAEPVLEEVEVNKNGDLGVKDVGMVPPVNDVDKPLIEVRRKGSRAPLIAGALALFLLVIASAAGVFYFSEFSGDTRQRASGGTCGAQCHSDGECGGGMRCVANSCKICGDALCNNAYCPAQQPAGPAPTQSPYKEAGYGFWNIGGLPHAQDINQWDVCYEFKNPCSGNIESGSDAWCGCNPVSQPLSIGCTSIIGGGSSTLGSPTRVVNGQGTACRPATTPTPTTPSAICGDNICNAGETCENGAKRPGYSGTGDPGSWQCLSTDIGKAPSGPATGACRYPGSPFGAPYCAQTPTPTPTPSPTPTPVAMCVGVKAWVRDVGKGCLPQVGTASGCIAGDYREIVPAQLTVAERSTLLQVGNTIRFTVRGSNATFTKARFSVNNGTPVESAVKYGADFYFDYQITQPGPVSVKAELWK